MKYKITSNFGESEAFRNHKHTGIDFSMPTGTELRSIRDGIVTQVTDLGNQNAGKMIKIKWEDGHEAIYGHLSKFKVSEGQHISAGDLIGYSGNSGFTTGAHLHFGLKDGNMFIDPSPYINDIQHMNDTGYLAQYVLNNSNTIGTSISDIMTQYLDALTEIAKSLKLNFIDLALSFEYTPIIKFFHYAMQFIFFNS
ncbi:M23 family metallopeptidase [Niallia alba]|uniref:M23 family metallopeptidase n=1 Tax=Niallia alba TaxID=2729105 RepID=UPI0039A0FCAA